MLSVLQVTPELNAGGVERTTIEMAEAISRAGGLALVASAGGRLEPDLKAAGGELIRLPMNSKNPVTVALNVGRLSSLVKKRNVRIIHARSRAPAWSAYLAARSLKLPFVTTYHGVYNARSPLKKFYNSVMARGDLVIANSEYTRTHILEEYDIDPGRVVTIPRGVDLGVFDRAKIDVSEIATLRAQWGMKPNDPRVLLILPARLTRWKGQLLLVEALSLLNAKRPNAVKAVLAGDAQGRAGYVEELERAIRASGLQDTVAIVGHLGQMATALAASDAAVFPSVEPEAFGRGAVEAQAMGVPVVAAAHGGLAETVLDGETGLLVPPGHPQALAAGLERLLDLGVEARRAMGLRGRDHVRSRYSKTALQASTLRVYDRLLGVRS
ncbi:glycosyltransferase family 4 protein [Terricaulis sp.]|uniref:glycosyltransferase family 4 protein n=1 Tax=Terricaulis sp. TaxID=2768686 RepID=UPI003783F97C